MRGEEVNEPACRCDCAYVGAQLAGTPVRCERCRGLVDSVAAERMDAVYSEALQRLEAWAASHPIRCPRSLTERP